MIELTAFFFVVLGGVVGMDKLGFPPWLSGVITATFWLLTIGAAYNGGKCGGERERRGGENLLNPIRYTIECLSLTMERGREVECKDCSRYAACREAISNFFCRSDIVFTPDREKEKNKKGF